MLHRDELARQIEQVANSELAGPRVKAVLPSWGKCTSLVKMTFGDLGKRMGYSVATSGYPGADDGEWLYDMVWYSMSPDKTLTVIPMVLESELKPGGSVSMSANVDGDFEKLVQARAEVRVWFALIPNSKLAELHIANCKHLATSFQGSMPGDTYVFIVFNWTTSLTSVEQFVVQAKEDYATGILN